MRSILHLVIFNQDDDMSITFSVHLSLSSYFRKELRSTYALYHKLKRQDQKASLLSVHFFVSNLDNHHY